MNRVLPYPLLIVSLIVMWLLLTSFSLGQLHPRNGCGACGCAGRWPPYSPAKPRISRWSLLPQASSRSSSTTSSAPISQSRG